jgi:hypothetical protein
MFPFTLRSLDICALENQEERNKIPQTIHVVGQLSELMLGQTINPNYVHPGNLIMQVCIGKNMIPNIIIDLGATINIMNVEVMQILNLQNLMRQTPTILQMADILVVKPEGILEDIVVKIDSWEYLEDFIILHPKKNIGGYPLILGHPWLATANAYIECCFKNMTISQGE